MTLLDKFDAIEIQNDTRITDGDREYCERELVSNHSLFSAEFTTLH